MASLPSIDAKCGQHFHYRDFIECSETYRASEQTNVPQSLATYHALDTLTRNVLDPTIDKFGPIKLTYGVACVPLTRLIKASISPPLDQHASHELSVSGKRICARRGAAVDFMSLEHPSLSIGQWITQNCAFDRLYFYGLDRPLHVSAGPENTKSVTLMLPSRALNRKVPRTVSIDKFIMLTEDDSLFANRTPELGGTT
jgi:hypothetical protein